MTIKVTIEPGSEAEKIWEALMKKREEDKKAMQTEKAVENVPKPQPRPV